MKKIFKIAIIALFVPAVVSAVDVNYSDDAKFVIYGGVSAYWFETVDSVNGFIADPDFSYNTKYWSNNTSDARITFISDWSGSQKQLGAINGNAEGFGILNNAGNWGLRIDKNTQNVRIFGSLFFGSSGAYPRIERNGNHAFTFYSNYISNRINLKNNQNVLLGAILGLEDGKFGLVNGADHWSVVSKTDETIEFCAKNQIHMIIKPNGNIGIGTNNPTYKFQVEGDAKINGKILAQPGGDLSMGSFTQQP